MPSINTTYAFLADYSNVAACLASIRALQLSGAFASNEQITNLLKTLEMDSLRKLYNITIRIRNRIDGTVPDFVPGDFEGDDFYEVNFNVGDNPQPGDFLAGDFYARDFFVSSEGLGYYDYSTAFRIVKENFVVFTARFTEITEPEKQVLDDALIRFLGVYDTLKKNLDGVGLDPCGPEYINNSPSLYLQAAGADGTVGIVSGIHLRWSLIGELGNNHLPAGSLIHKSSLANPYNRVNDFVQLYRTPYTPLRFNLQFDGARPSVNYADSSWTYFLNAIVDNRSFTHRLKLTFMDVGQYNQIAAGLDPQTGSANILRAYNGLLEFQLLNKTAFSAGFDFRTPGSGGIGLLKLEMLSIADSDQGQVETITIRERIASDTGEQIIYGDNIARIRLQKTAGSFLQSFSFETYHDFLTVRTDADWTPVGNGFGLSLDDQVVLGRLDNTKYQIDNHWPQYNDGTRVRVANYQDKWQISRPNDPSIKDMLTQYLSLSETDPRAEDVVKDEDADPSTPGLLVSYLDVLNLMALDYHIARMLGLGFIDTDIAGSTTEKFIYQVRYTNRSNSGGAVVEHRYAALPTAVADSRLTLKPAIRPITYQLPTEIGDAGSQVFDSRGYATHDRRRLVNIGRQTFTYEKPSPGFFDHDDPAGDFNIFEHTRPVLYGIEYRAEGQAAYVKPEITQEKTIGFTYYAYDDAFPDTGIPENVPVTDNPDSLYIHLEQKEGVHYYAIYGINWFARASVLSDEMATDATEFQVVNRLSPPADIAVQYIQQEDTLLLTTATEQNWLAGRNTRFKGKDVSFTRLTFNWLDIIDISDLPADVPLHAENVVKADTIRTWFKPDAIRQVSGLITDIVTANGDDRLLMLNTGSYRLLDGTLIAPSVDDGDLERFAGSLLVTQEGQFVVVSLVSATDGLRIIIEKSISTQATEDPENPGFYGTTQNVLQPSLNSRFTLTENLKQTTNWLPVQADVELVDFSVPDAPVIETRVDSEGNAFRDLIGGISGRALVQPLFGEGVLQNMPGYYSVTYESGIVLVPHPQINLPYDPAFPDRNTPDTLQVAHVEWYKGLIRMPFAVGGTKKKLVQVARIVQSNPLTIYIYDPTYLDDGIQISATINDLISEVNFHPGYKVYLFAEPAPNHAFNRSNILPVGQDTDRKTLIGLQSADLRLSGTGFTSGVSLPGILFARNIQEPLQPDEPINYGLKVRPDATGKAAFTFDVPIAAENSGVARNPFGMAFYRTTNEEVLFALYQPATVNNIKNDLSALTEDPHFNQRYAELLNLKFSVDGPGHFQVFEAQPQPYGFPVPDLPSLVNATDTPEVRMEKYRLAIWGTLMPLTEQTPVLAFVKTGLQTENKLPAIRDVNGLLLGPAQEGFDPFPMVRKYVKTPGDQNMYVRFTDYKLFGSSRFLYFYAAAEVTNQLVAGPLSLFTGPVSILQSLASDSPLIRHVSIDTTGIEQPITVSFKIAPFSAIDRISAIRLYRTTAETAAISLQGMGAFVQQEIAEGYALDHVVTDTLEDMLLLPMGETLYYRLAGVRKIINEMEQEEEVVTHGSEVIAVRLIDTLNPEAPQITYHEDTNTLNWPATANKSSYFLFNQNERGNWQRVYAVTPPVLGDMTYVLPAPLPKVDAQGNPIYHRFKVKVQNSSGLFNLVDKELTI
ncbi:hypothetical protein [Mucilaginibacter rubeus]|uniref:Uncharacterized protein n=1 Tax=Mucilaginibacter rubeus TaxID=2027860 RepID=A0A5C1HXH8_9SPHI|nr:hypothetical protein [Mucilaginibacter rubeus]QEM10597.1 hypothetical protein DEO27_011390 [Mucilaginibacter rubeus]